MYVLLHPRKQITDKKKQCPFDVLEAAAGHANPRDVCAYVVLRSPLPSSLSALDVVKIKTKIWVYPKSLCPVLRGL